MIGFLPSIYPDELVYSWFCRIFVHSGLPTSKAFLEELLFNRHCNPSKEFIGHLKAEMEQEIKKIYPMEELVLGHTMFPQYARFIEPESKKNALHRLMNDFCDAHHLFSILPRSERDQYLKYCPVCMEDDREIYGEAYWHRVHQIRNMTVCTKHKCRLENSVVTAKSSQSFILEPAEVVLVEGEVRQDIESLELEFASYMEEIFQEPVDFEGSVPISAILYSGMENTKYLKSTGRIRNTQLLAEDMQDYVKGICMSNTASIYQVQRTLLGQRTDFSIVTQIAFFLGISVQELLHPRLSVEQMYKSQNARCPKENIPEDWDSYDEGMLPEMEKVAKNIYQGKMNGMGRPEKVTERLLCKHAGISPHRLENMPKCRGVLGRYEESYEECWARRLVWAYGKVKEEKEGQVYWSDIRVISGVKRERANKALPYLEKHTDKKTAEEIIDLLLGDGEGIGNHS